MASSASVGSPG